MNKPTVPASDEAWDERVLGADDEFVKVADSSITADIDEAACTQMISLRVQKSLIEDFKVIASLNNGIGYQTLMKQILQRFVDSEKKRIFRELAYEKLEARKESAEGKASAKPSKSQRKVA